MRVQLKIATNLYESVKTDLLRPHPFAAERIGFLRAKVGNNGHEPLLILAYDYLVVEDEDYIDDYKFGATIGSNAIRKIVQHILDTGDTILHTHLHDNAGVPGLSRPDKESIPPLVKSFQNVAPNNPHGIFLLSMDSCASSILLPAARAFVPAEKISIIGYPLKITHHE